MSEKKKTIVFSLVRITCKFNHIRFAKKGIVATRSECSFYSLFIRGCISCFCTIPIANLKTPKVLINCVQNIINYCM